MTASYDDVARLAMALPEVTEGERWGRRTWLVGTKGFVWERPFSKADIKRFGSDPVPEGPILGVATEDLAEKEAILATGADGVFTIAHFENYPAYLIQLDVVDPVFLEDAVLDAWLAIAPPAVARAHMEALRGEEPTP